MLISKLKINYFPELSALLLGRAKPSMVSVNLTEKCNQNCIYCEIGKTLSPQHKDFLTKEDLFWIIDQMSINKLTRLSMCGGEPFLFCGIIDVVAYAWENNIRCNITSNGMIVSDMKEAELRILKDCKTAINISVDSFEDTIQTQTRGVKLALTNATKSILRLQQMGIPVTVLSAISKYNYRDLYNSLVKAYELGIKQVLYQPIIYYSNYPDRQVIKDKSLLNVGIENVDILMDQLEKINRFERKFKINTNVYRIIPWISSYIKGATGATSLNDNFFFNDVVNKFYCREVYAVIDIDYNGGIQPCGLSKAEINIYKNKDSGLFDLWSESTRNLKNELINNRYPDYCNGCCHKFSKNMLASVIKYPISNRTTFAKIFLLIISRILSRLNKKLFIKK